MLVEDLANATISNLKTNTKIFSKSGRHLFTWRLDNNQNPSIHFPKDLAILINNNSLNINKISEFLKEVIDEMLKSIN
ncbi:hypothetical protein MIDIC_10014 [Alphaproteobacteria bacterium]